MAVSTVAVSILLIYLTGSGVQLVCLTAIVKHTEWKNKPGFVLIVSLALSDLCYAVSSAFGCFESVIGHPIVPFIFISTFLYYGWAASTAHMVFLSINRFIAIMFPTDYAIWCSGKRTRCTVGVCFVFGLLYSVLLNAFGPNCYWGIEALNLICSDLATWHFVYIIYGLTISAIVIPSFCYIVISSKLVKLYLSAHLANQSQEDISICGQFFIIIFVYLIQEGCFFALAEVDPDDKVAVIFPFIVALNYTVNGFIYLVFNTTIRDAVKKLFKKPVAQQPSANNRTVRQGRPNNQVTPL